MTDALSRLKTAIASRYTIEGELGRGGMATVYLAEDLKHKRHVAIKVLDPELARALGAERFLREVEVTAKLTHPHILALHDSGEADGFLYYVMPYIEGETLRERMDREGQLPLDDALQITKEVASALSYAHSHDVIHRDIKPENVLFQAGEVVVADFGIALAVDSAGGTRLTETGFSLGTPAYMSPEQVSGEQEIDGRSDVYSLACVLYEMLAGDPPFIASNPRAVFAKHMTDPVPPITTARSSVPLPVASAITRALGKAPVDRFDSAKAFSDALFAEEKDAEHEVKSIVVLPFENLSPDPENAFFADGLTEELIADLSKVQALRVISRTSAMHFKGTTKRVPTIAQELNVRYVLEGSVRRVGGSLRITAQLIDAKTDAHLWAEKYGGTIEDVFDLQERLSREILAGLRANLTAEEDRQLAARPIASAAVYDCYLRAMESIWECTEASLARAVEHLERGIGMAGESALLRGALAYVYYQHANIGLQPTDQFRRQAREHADGALAEDPEAPLAHLAIGLLNAFESPAEGIRSFKRVLQMDHNNVDARLWLAIVMGSAWKPEAGQAHLQAARVLDPLHPMIDWIDGHLLVMNGDFEPATRVLRESLRSVRLPVTVWQLALSLAYLGRREEACPLLREAFAGDEDNVVSWLCKVLAHVLRNERESAWQILRADLHASVAAHHDFMYALFVAECHALLDDTAGAFEWLERSVGLGMINYPFLSEYDPFLTPLRAERRFQQLMERVKREWEGFEV